MLHMVKSQLDLWDYNEERTLENPSEIRNPFQIQSGFTFQWNNDPKYLSRATISSKKLASDCERHIYYGNRSTKLKGDGEKGGQATQGSSLCSPRRKKKNIPASFLFKLMDIMARIYQIAVRKGNFDESEWSHTSKYKPKY